MALTLTIADDSFQNTWDDCVFKSQHGTIFHTWKWLKLAEIQTSSKLLPIVIYKGTQIFALYPIFLQKIGFFNLAYSPPTKAYLVYLGLIIVDYESLKQEKKENRFIQIQEEVDKFLFENNKCIVSRIRTSPGILDSRPLRWNGYHIESLYTYRIPLTKGVKIVWENLDGPLRISIKKAIRDGVTVRLGNWEDIEYIHNAMSKRYLQQGFKSRNNLKYLRSLYDIFYPENLKIFVAEYKGERVGGEISLFYKDVMYHWIGAPKSSLVGISPNDLVLWEAIKWSIEHDFKISDILDDGRDPRLRVFKAKWNPDLSIWFEGTRYASPIFAWGERLLRMLHR
jgi:hypothetical protein